MGGRDGEVFVFFEGHCHGGGTWGQAREDRVSGGGRLHSTYRTARLGGQ